MGASGCGSSRSTGPHKNTPRHDSALMSIARVLKNYLAHLRRYGLHTSRPAALEILSRRMNTGCYLLLPVPGKDKLIPVPRPQVAYRDFGEGLRPGPGRVEPTKAGFNRLQIRKLLKKYGLLEKRGAQESSA